MESIFNTQEAAEWMDNYGIWAVFASLLLSIAIGVLGVVPSVFLSGANAIVFGLPTGFALSLAGEVLGAYVSYWLYRKGIRSIRKKDTLNGRWSRAFANAGHVKQLILMFFARLTPFLPSGVITFVAAWTQMNIATFMVATTLGKAPSVAAEVWVGHDLFYVIKSMF